MDVDKEYTRREIDGVVIVVAAAHMNVSDLGIMTMVGRPVKRQLVHSTFKVVVSRGG